MFQVVLLGLATTAAALPLLREAVNVKEGVNLPIYKPWYNAYSKHVYGSQYDLFNSNYYSFGDRRYFQDNYYDSSNVSPYVYLLNYFSKYMRPEMIHTNSIQFPDMFSSNMRYPYHSNMFGHMSDLLRNPLYNYVNKHDYMYRPYSKEYLNENMENLYNTDLSYSTDYSNFVYRPYSPEYILSFMRHYINNLYPHSYNKNIFDYMYRPYSNEYMYENMDINHLYYPFFDKEYKYFNYPEFINFRNTILPFIHNTNMFDNSYRPFFLEYIKNMFSHHNMNDYDYMYRPYSSIQHKFDSFDYKPYYSGYPQNNVDLSYPSNNEHGYSHTFPNYHQYMNMKNAYYPYFENVHRYHDRYVPYSPEYINGQNFNVRYPFYNKNNYWNMQYPFYHNYFDGVNYGPHQFPEYMRFKREVPQNVRSEEKLEVEQPVQQVGQEVVARGAEILNQPVVNVDAPVTRTRRDVEVQNVPVPQFARDVIPEHVQNVQVPQYARDAIPDQIPVQITDITRVDLQPTHEAIVEDRIPEVPAHQQPIETEHTRKARAVAVPVTHYYYPYRTVYPHYRTYALTYPYHPLYYSSLHPIYYYKK